MSLLDDLRNLDLSGIVDARAGISASVSGDEVTVIIDGGAITSALGPLGERFAEITAALDDPEALLEPLLAVFAELLDGLAGELPIADFAGAVTEATGVLARLIDGVAADPLSFGGTIAGVLPDAVQSAERAAGAYQLVGLDGLGRFGALVSRAEDGLPGPEAIAELAVDVLSPFPRSALDGLRSSTAGLLAATGAIALPATRTQGLVARFDAITLAAEAGDAAAVQRLLAELDGVRARTVDVVRADLASVTAAIDRLPVAGVAAALSGAGDAFASAEQSVLELLASWRAEVAGIRAFIEDFDAADVIARLEPLVDKLEVFLRETFEEPMNAVAARVGDLVHELFGHIPVRSVREAVSTALRTAVEAVEDADLDGPAQQIRDLFGRLRDLIDLPDLGEQIRDALGDVTGTLDTALDGVIGAMNAVKDAIEAIAEPAAEVLGRAVEAVESFQASVTSIAEAIDAIDLNAAADEVIAQVRGIREAVEGVVSEVPLPEPVRPLVTQLVEQLEALDLSGNVEDNPLFTPLLDAVNGLKLSETLGAVVHDGLTALRDAVAKLVPAELIADIETEIQAALDVVAGFDPASLLSGVTEHIDGLADAIEGIDLDGLAAAAHEPFHRLLDGWDRLRPSTLLEPVSTAYRSALTGLSLPSPIEAVTAAAAQVQTGADAAGRTATAPAGDAVPGAPPPAAGVGDTPRPPRVPTEAELADLRPGDIIRMFGYLPGKLREAIAALDAGPAGAALDAIDAMAGGLARDLRRVAAALAGIESHLDTGLDALVTPLAPAHARAQIALSVNFGDGAALDVDLALDGLNRAGPASMRAELVPHTAEARGRVAGAGARHASVAASLLAVADNLERSPLADLTGGVDALLAALDPEPLAVEVDELVYAIIGKAPQVFEEAGPALVALANRVIAMVGALNPAALAQRALDAALTAFQEELAVLDPELLAAELDEIHQAVRATLAAYDPAQLIAEIDGVRQAVVTALRDLDPAELLGDLTGLGEIVAKAQQALPAEVLSGLPAALTDLDEAFAGIDLDPVLDRVEGMAPEVLEAFQRALAGVRDEIVALLESLRYATARIEASVEVRT